MKANELMIGDWVFIDHCSNRLEPCFGQVKGIDKNGEDVYTTDGMVDISLLKPIPLTAETLEQCGFTTKDEPGHWTGYRSYSLYGKDKKCLFMLRLYEKDVRCEISLNSCPYYIVFRYLHELQHPLRHLGVEIKPEGNNNE